MAIIILILADGGRHYHAQSHDKEVKELKFLERDV